MINEGDTVQVVRGHICDLGHVEVVAKIETDKYEGWHCSSCGARGDSNEPWAACRPNGFGYPISWLRRIPPMSELEGAKQKEDIREPA